VTGPKEGVVVEGEGQLGERFTPLPTYWGRWKQIANGKGKGGKGKKRGLVWVEAGGGHIGRLSCFVSQLPSLGNRSFREKKRGEGKGRGGVSAGVNCASQWVIPLLLIHTLSGLEGGIRAMLHLPFFLT